MSLTVKYPMGVDGLDVHHLRQPESGWSFDAGWSFCGMPWLELSSVTTVEGACSLCLTCWDRDGLLGQIAGSSSAPRLSYRGWGDLVR
jgi:hypothetical protein